MLEEMKARGYESSLREVRVRYVAVSVCPCREMKRTAARARNAPHKRQYQSK